ncbi:MULTISPECIES: hypothetical protein [Moraxella]|uniref:hypothetical protein n=1 Tax=Moraxella TaxID=475 RepID=UPI0012DE5808|nr:MULTISPECIES: hypothetical protein [Moraxella]MBE9578488.1 hypothetical protein [Moraxella sp. K1664]MBE9587525.1 hypothetical protein [Moraxella sp. K1630]MBE9595980.1 hypothetical protein [Moraxella sp. K2450]MDH9217788.1 hypothetical protein [Moraxella lacunata]
MMFGYSPYKPVTNIKFARHALATRLEVVDNAYTGGVTDLPSFKDGEIFHAK